MMNRRVSLEEVLSAREARAERQHDLLRAHGLCVITYMLNVPGPIKQTEMLGRAFRLGLARLCAALNRSGQAVAQAWQADEITGSVWMAAVEGAPQVLKRLACALEAADDLGRLMDVDVLMPDGVQLNRSALGLPPRTCLICGKDARLCGRSRAHPWEMLFAKVEAMARDALEASFADHIAALAQRAVLYEVAVTPKPGLVDRANSGAHRDMDYFTFMDSASILAPYFRDCVLLGLRVFPELLLDALRNRGLAAETAMLAVTGNLNTHKGAIFGLGLLCGAAGQCGWAAWPDEAALCGAAAVLAGPVLMELIEAPPSTAGLKLYHRLGIRGARGEAASGYASVREYALPALRRALARGWTLEQAGMMALLALLATAEDTNLLARGTLEQRQALAERARTLSEADAPPLDALRDLDAELIREHISPGGCADLLAITFFLHFVQSEISY